MLTGNNRVRQDVYDESLDEKMAPSLGGVVTGKEHEIYMKPDEFFKRTLVTEQMMEILTNILSVLKDGKGKKILILSTLYGGGKTHTLLTLYHALKAPHALAAAKPENESVKARISKFIEEISALKTPDIVIIDGYFSELAPTSLSPLDVKAYKVYTLWGYLAHSLGNYALMRKYDEKAMAPPVDDLFKVLENKAVVILIDEIAHYIKRLHESGDPKLEKYSSSVEAFVETLAKAIEMSRSVVLIISLPAEKKGEEFIVESTYRTIQQSLKNIFRALGRVNHEYVEPISPRNIPALLKTRLFEEVDTKKARDVYEAIYKAYGENQEIFGKEKIRPEEILETYPFHPLYISTLIEILDKHGELQKTRDLLRISRKVLREVLRDNRYYDLIMPWHIDLENDSIRNMLLLRDYEEFKPVVEEDIKRRANDYEKPGLARIVAKTLLVRTFIYGGGLALPPKIEALPSEQDLARMVYEPVTFNKEGWLPKDIIDAIKWISTNLLYVLRDEKSGRLWFTKYVTPIKYIEERARRVEDPRALEMIRDYTERLLSRPITDLIGGRFRAKPKVLARLFNLELSKAMINCEPIDADTRSYVLLACINVPEGEEQRKTLFEEILYRVKSGGSRRYANTIFITFPGNRRSIDESLEYAKKLVACKEVKEEGIIERLVGSIGEKEAEILKEILERKIIEYENNVLEKLLNSILAMFNRVAYPYYEKSILANTVREAECSTTGDSILMNIERCLSAPDVMPGKGSKMKDAIDYDDLEFFLRNNMNIDISDGSEPRSVGSIIDYFYSNPRLPAVPADAIKEALKDGVKHLAIGIRANGKIYYKKIYEKKEIPETYSGESSEGEPPSSLRDEYEVLPWKMALFEQLKSLKRRELVENGVRKVEEYIVRIGGKDIPVEEVVSNIDKFDYEQLRSSYIIRIVRTVAVKIEVQSKTREAKPSEKTSIDIYISSIGPYKGEVVLKPSTGKVEKERFKIDESFTREKITWWITAPLEPGLHKYTIEARDAEGSLLDIAEVIITVPGEIGWHEGIPHPGTPVTELEVIIKEKLSLKPLDILKKKLEEATIVSSGNLEVVATPEKDVESRISLSASNVKLSDLLTFALSTLSKYQLLVRSFSLQVNIKPKKNEPLTMPVFSEDEKKSLSECKIRYKIT